MRDFFQEFRAFAIKGNVMDLAVAVIIGAAFGKIVSSLVDNMIMPVIGIFLGGINFSGRAFSFGEITIRYGVFLQNVIDFFIISLVVFVAVRAISRFKKAESAVVEEKPAPVSDEVRLLSEIRDLLRKE